MARFPTAGHLASWAKFAPGINSSAGKTKGNGSTGHGNRYLARVLGEAAVAAGRTDTFVGARYRRIARTPRQEESNRRGRPVHPGHHLAHPRRPRHPIPRPRRRPLRPTRQHRRQETQPHPPTRSARLPRHPRTRQPDRHRTATPTCGLHIQLTFIFGLAAPYSHFSCWNSVSRRSRPTESAAWTMILRVREGEYSSAALVVITEGPMADPAVPASAARGGRDLRAVA